MQPHEFGCFLWPPSYAGRRRETPYPTQQWAFGAKYFYRVQEIDRDDTIYGRPGADYLYDASGRNNIEGGPGTDFVAGHSRLLGGTGDDRISGETGVVGGPRGILGGAGEDCVDSREDTNDTIYVSDGQRDTVGCGDGTDTVYFDKGIDKFVDNSGCENRVPK